MVRFEEGPHRYSTLDDRGLLSVSGLMHQFEPQEDWNAIARKVAKKQGKTTQEILDLWDMKRNRGSEAGTLVHKQKENELLAQRGELTIEESPCDATYKYALDVSLLKDNTVYPELMIYDLEHMVCGQSDIVRIDKGSIHVEDYKTDKSIERKAFSNEWTPAKKLLPPVAHLDCCNYNTYSLKMSLYMYLVWKANKGRFKPGNITLIWCPLERDEEGIPVLYNGLPRILKEERIDIPYRKKEVMAMLATLK